MAKSEDDNLIEIAKQYEDCVYLQVSNINSGDKLAYHIGEESGIVEPCSHLGMIQDSILYRKFGDDDMAFDFRYFPERDYEMETYSWSDNIKHAVIKNICDFPIKFNGDEIASGETKVFTQEGHFESLISPDCYNGKSFFGGVLEDERII